MYARRLEPVLMVSALLITLLYFFPVAILSADNTGKTTVAPVEAQYKEDYNGDGRVNVVDVIALLLFQRDNPGDPGGDYNGDGTPNIADAISLIINIHGGNLTPLQTFSLSGRVVESGQGLHGVDIRIESPDIVAKVTTDSVGMFCVENLPEGTYVIWCKKSEYNYTFSPEEMEVIISGNSITVTDIEAIFAAYTLSGRVLEDSIGMPGVTVSIQGVGLDTAVVTDSDGIYRIDGLLDANYAVLPVKENYSFTPISVSGLIWGESVIVPDIIATPAGPSPTVLYTIGGRVTCAVQAQVNVEVLLSGDIEASTITDGNGFFFFLVPNGSYTIMGVPNPTFQMFNPISYDITVEGEDILNLHFLAWGIGGS